MKYSQENLACLLAALGDPAQAATPAEVWGQTEYFRPETWRRGWPNGLHLPGFLQRPDKVLKVSRRRLFELGENIDTVEDAVSFYTAVCAWGAGTNGQQTYRCLKPLFDPHAPIKLLHGLQSASASGADGGYALFNHGGPSKIKGLGPAFFTKLLYFAAGQPSPADTRHPLILDSRVAFSLGWKVTGSWPISDYSRYLDLVEQVHKFWRPDLPTDVIEFTLFYAGGIRNAPSI